MTPQTEGAHRPARAGRDPGQFLRIRDVMAETGLSRSTIYRLEQAGDFPNRVKLSANAMGWWSADIDAWKAKRREQGSG